MRPTVLKFGGTSVEDAAAFARVAGIVAWARRSASPVVVVSAMSGFTDSLVAAARDAGRGMMGLGLDVERHLERHRIVAARLLGSTVAFEKVLGNARVDLGDLLARGEEDEVASYGERLASPLLAAVLAERGIPAVAVDARTCILTDDALQGAAPVAAETDRRTREVLQPLLAGGMVPVLGGFIASAPGGRTTTLGRGGSDYSAALVAAALDAAELQIWTDVSGVLTVDPWVVPGARAIPRLSYAEAAELAYFGAKVLHPRTMQPVMDRGIPIRVCNSGRPEEPGTVVAAQAEVWSGTVKAIAHKTGVSVVQVTSGRMLGAYGFLRALFEICERHRAVVDLVSTSEVSVSLTIDDPVALPQIAADLQALGDVSVERDQAIVCVVGEGVRTTPGIAAAVFDTMRDINVLLISQGASRINLGFVIAETAVPDAIIRLHRALLEPGRESRETVCLAGAPGPTDVVAVAARLVDIPSVTGEEAELARYLEAYLVAAGWEVELQDVAPGRRNLLATTAGAPAWVVFCTHLDTVAPFLPARVADGHVIGRGACDAKGIIAAQIAAAERLRGEGATGVGLLFVVDEEVGSLGARAANAWPRARECQYVIVGEPTDNRLVVGCKGSLRVALDSTGSGGHSAHPERGRSAIHELVTVLAELQAYRWPGGAFFGTTTLNIGTFAGGTASNVLAPTARAEVHFRLATDAETIERLLADVVRGRAVVERLSVTPAVRLPAVPGLETSVVGFTSDAPHLTNWGTALVLGPGSIADAHQRDERIAVAELERGVETYVRLARLLLREGIR